MAEVSSAPWGTRDTAPPLRPRHPAAHHALAWTIGVLATLVGLIVLAWAVLFVTKGRFLKHPFERLASNYTHRAVTVAGDFNFYFDPIATRFKAEGISVSNPAWASKPNLFQAQLVDTRIDTWRLLFGTRHIQWINLIGGAIDAEWDAGHKTNTWTFDTTPAAKPEPFQMPLIDSAVVAGTSVRYRDPQARILADIRFDTLAGAQNKFRNAIRFAGTGSARGTPFTLQGSQLTPNQLLAGGTNQFELHAQAVKSRVDISGTLPGATVIEGADLAVNVEGRNLRDLLDLAGIAVPDTRAYHLRGHLTKQGDEYRVTRIVGTYGTSDLGGSVTVKVPAPKTDERLLLTADLASRRVDLIDIGPFIGYNPTALATKGAKAAATTQHAPGDYPRILPDAPLRVDAIRTFDAKVRYKVADIKQPFVPISNIDLGLDLDHGLLKLTPLTFDMAGGHVTADISVDARAASPAAVVTDYDIRVSPTPMGKLLAKFGVAESGTTGTVGARVQMKGTGNTVRQSLATSNGRIAIVLPRGTFWMSYAQLAEFDVGTFLTRLIQHKLKEPVQVNCGLIAFTVRDGVAAADPVLIDTAKNVMTARGGFSFRDESIDLAFRARAKTVSLFSGQSPVGIGGHFAAPSIQIVTPQLLTRAGIGVALGVAAGPAALLAFVDPGGTQAAQCGPVLAGARAAEQETVKGKPVKGVGDGTSGAVKAEEKHKKFLGIF